MNGATDAGAVAFTDVVGFTEFNAVHGDAEAVALLDLQGRLVRDALPGGARVVKELGDGLLLWFPEVPPALDACLDLQARFTEKALDPNTPLWVRIGMHWGTPARRGDDLLGNDVNIAARIVDHAGPGELLVSDDVRRQVEGAEPGFAFDELGPIMLKGIPGAVRLFKAERP